MARTFPSTQAEMMGITSVTAVNYEKFGRTLLEVTSRYMEEFLGGLLVRVIFRSSHEVSRECS